MPYLEGKVVVITGGGTGIGRATSLLLAKEGAKVVVNYSKSEEDANKTVAEIQEAGGDAKAVKADVSKDEQARALIDAAISEYGRVDILVNSAGCTKRVPMTDLDNLTEEIWDRMYDVNVKGAFFCSRAAIHAMRKGRGGQIINITSASGYTGVGSSLAYAVSKGAMTTLTRGLAKSQAPEIRVNGVAPGFVQTRWIAGMEDIVEAAREITPLKRVATPEDVARAVFGLLINEQITGHTVVVDGGTIMN